MSDEVIQIRKHLADIPPLLEEASHYFIPGSAPIDPTATRGAMVYRIPIVPAIFDLLDDKDKALDDIYLNRRNGERRLGVLPTLGLWVSLSYMKLDELGRNPRTCCTARKHTVAGEIAWLSEYALDITRELYSCCDHCSRGRRAEDDRQRGCRCGCFRHDIELLWGELRQACRIRKEYIPKCPRCGHRIEGIYGQEGDEYPAWYRCTGCPTTWLHEAELKRLGATQPPMTLIQMAAFLGKPVRDLHRLRENNRFLPVGRNSRGGALYEVEHVREAAKKVKNVPLSA